MQALLASLIGASLLFGGYAHAQDKKGKIPERTQKVLVDSLTFRVTETTYPRGSGTASTQPGQRVTRAIKGGTLERTYTDGKKEVITWKDGQVREQPAAKGPYALRNIGKTEMILYTVAIKKK